MKSIYHPLEVHIKKNISTLLLGQGFGWVAIAIGSFVSHLHFSARIDFDDLLCNGKS
jgi:hypothetical protein